MQQDSLTERSDELIVGKTPFRRQFLDAMVVEESGDLKRVFHSATKYQGNPVMPKDKPWEGWGPFLYGTVLWDEGKLKMFYHALGKDSGDVMYAESQDGINWVKPELGIIEYKGSKKNNILGMGGKVHNPSVIKVENPTSPARKWAMYGHTPDGIAVTYSKDGLHWNWNRPAKHKRLVSGGDVVNVTWDPYEKRYIATLKTSNRRHRAVGIGWSKDGLKWEIPIKGPVFGADDLDTDATQVYGMPVFAYQGMYIGLPWMYRARWLKYGKYTAPTVMYEAQEESPRTMEPEFTWSWNLISWVRNPDRKAFIELGPPDSFDQGMITTARSPVLVGDELYFYYGGFWNIHDDDANGRCAIGLATLRLDGFCSMHAESSEGWLISRREIFNTPKVTINAKCAKNGYVTAEIVDRHNKVLKGFTREDCVPFDGDSVRAELTWKTKNFPKDLIDKDRKIKFYIKNADLYSYMPADINQEIDDGHPSH